MYMRRFSKKTASFFITLSFDKSNICSKCSSNNMGWNTKLLGRSSAVTMLLLAFLLLVCVIYFTIIGKWEKEDK